ncbi:MAG: glutamine-hydrolyzing GMP synthase [Deltaproteobacteria bacterium]|nr:glutamine-hydrolyzing GMP synthase [Deltaproteobacteria bacterium]
MLFPKYYSPHQKGILIIDYGSQYTFLIARRLRELGAYTEIVSNKDALPSGFEVQGFVLSGSPRSADGADTVPAFLWESGKPILGICYGMQLISHAFGGQIRSQEKREYGRAQLSLTESSPRLVRELFADTPSLQTVWMSHGDDVETAPPEFETYGVTESKASAVLAHRKLPIIGLQFHPEVHHTDWGKTILQNFANRVCGMNLDWTPQAFVEELAGKLEATLGPQDRVLLAISGGVDSTVCGVLLTKILGKERVTCVFVDHGLLRSGEADYVSEKLGNLGLNLTVLERSELFLQKIAGVSDAEEKRKIIGRTFIEVFEKFATGRSFTHFAQGTLYPDVIESSGAGSQAEVIKSHHNVGGLPETLKLSLLEPFRFLFKDEVRRLGKDLGLPEFLLNRHPFPGPGLAIRIPGEVSKEKVSILQKADQIFSHALREHGFYEKIWQAGVVLLPVKSVGVMGDKRTYEYTCVLRAVHAADAMTAQVGDLPLSFLTGVADQIVRKVPGINRVLYDVTSKPPATIEWE